MTTDAFRHVPGLRGKLKPAEESELRITPEVMAVWDERARLQGRPANWRLPDPVREASRRATLAGLPAGEDLWIFGYGSLMWDPAVHFTEVRRATLAGYHRRFVYRVIGGRGSPDCPALMLSLEPGSGGCQGLAFRIPAATVETESALFWRREMIRGIYQPVLMPVSTPQGELDALVLVSNTAHEDYVGELPLADSAAIVATGMGVLGTNRHYLDQLAGQLANLGIEDAYVNALLEAVDRQSARPDTGGA